MSRRPARFTEAEARRAAKVAKAEGMAVEFLPDGTIRLIHAQEIETKGAGLRPGLVL